MTFTYVVTNTGNVPLANVVVTDDKLGPITSFTGDTNNNGLLDLTETWTYTQTATALAGQQTNVGTVTAQDANNPPGTTVTDDNPANYFGDAPGINIVKFVNGQDADSPTGPHVAVGSTVTFTYVVTNTGNVPLANVAVTDDKLGPITSFTGDTNNNGLLDLTETWTYTQTATALAGQQTNVGTVTAQDANNPPGTTVTDDNPANYFGDAPGINIVKFVNGQDADSPTGPHVAVGSTVTYTYVVTDTGNVPLANVVVTDDKLGPITSFTGDTNNNDLLDLTETWTYTQTATALAGQQTNVGTVTAQDANNPPGTTVTDDNPANYFGDAPGINIVKEAVPGQIADVAGETLNYTITVANTGNTTLTGVVVTDPNANAGSIVRGADAVGDNDGLLEVGETWTYTAAHTVTQAEIDAGAPLVNVATADSTETGPDTDDATVPVAQAPSLNIVKEAVPGQIADVAGETLNYTITVANTGNTTLTGVVVTDPNANAGSIVRGADAVGDNDGLLEVGETWSYTAAHTVTQAEIDAGAPLVNVATADSTQSDTDTDDATVPVDQNPALNIVKEALPGQIADVAGETLNYTITVANTGNTTLTGVAVTDPNADAGSILLVADAASADGELDVGETWSYTATHTVTQAEIDAGAPLVNVATADSTQSDTDTDDATVPVDQNPALNIVKEALPGQIADVAGETLNYTITVDEHRQHDADRGCGDRSECGCGLDLAGRRRGFGRRRVGRWRDLELHGDAYGDAGRDRRRRALW